MRNPSSSKKKKKKATKTQTNKPPQVNFVHCIIATVMLPVLLDLSDIKILCMCDIHWSGGMLFLFYMGHCYLLNPKQNFQSALCISKLERFVKTQFRKATRYKPCARIIRGNIKTSTYINYLSLPLANILAVFSFLLNIFLSAIFKVFFLTFIFYTQYFWCFSNSEAKIYCVLFNT